MTYAKVAVACVLLLLGVAALARVPRSPEPQVSAAIPNTLPFSIRLAFGYGKEPQERWTGSISFENVQISEANGWLIQNNDRVSLNTFDIQTLNPNTKAAAFKGVILRGTGPPSGRIAVATNHGQFSFRISEIKAGVTLEFLDSRTRVTGLTEAWKLTDDSRNDDYPSIAAMNDTTAWVVWQSYSGQMDEIRLSKHDDKGWHTFTTVPGGSGDLWRPQIAIDGQGLLWVAWSQQVDGNFDIYARALDDKQDTWLDTVRLSSDPGPDIDHHLVADRRGGLWVVWQGFHGRNSDVFLRHYDGSGWSEETRITENAANDWEPRVALDSRGRAHIVWDTYRNGNYDVYMRILEGGRLGPEVPVTRTNRFEAHASVAVDSQDRVWVAWDESSANWGKDSGPTTDPKWLEKGQATWDTWIRQPSTPGARLYESRKLNLAVFEGTQRKSPAHDLQTALTQYGETDHDYPQLFADPGSGRMALLFHRWGQMGPPVKQLYPRAAYWEQALMFYEGDRWTSPAVLPESWGRISMRAQAAFGPAGSFWVVWPMDARLYERSFRAPVASVFAARIPLEKGTGAAQLTAWKEAPPEERPAIHLREPQDVAAVRSYRTIVRGVENRIVRGDLHRHAEFSWDSLGGLTDGSLFDYYRYMLDGAAMDFGGLTDHNSGGDYEYFWWLIEKSCDMYNVPGAFATLYAYERSVAYPDGHRNIFHTRRGHPIVSFFTKSGLSRPRPGIAAQTGEVLENDTKLLYESLRRTKGISIPHTSATNMGTDWRDNDPEVEPVVEIFQGDRNSSEHPGAPRAARRAEDKTIGGFREEGFLWNAYRKGIRIGSIASSDHWSTHISYAMVYTEQPTRQAIFDAIKKRHTYGATDNIILDCRMGDYFMGDEFTDSSVPPLEIRIIGTSGVALIEIIKDAKVVYSTSPNQKDVKIVYQDQNVSEGTSYYYVRAVQDDHQIAWGSPIWVTRKP